MSNLPSAVRRRRVTGTTLIEVLVALLVLSFGLLGLAGLQTLGLRSSHGSYVRGQAVLLAYDMADRLRTNRLGVVTVGGNYVGFYNSQDGANYQGAVDKDCTQTGGTVPGPCSVADVAAHDMFEWTTTLGLRLPSGAGTVCRDATPDDGTAPGTPACTNAPGDPYAIKVWWAEIQPDGVQTKRFAMRFQP